MILNARRQNGEKGACFNELVKNSDEAEATEVHINVFQHQESNQLILQFKDNGWGMDRQGLQKLKSIGESSKDQDGERNHGWGFYQALGAYLRVEVITSKGGEGYLTVFQQKRKIS
ncbi:MAG: ATP-binding protein [Parachlamydiaceae bacterium]|nr:MAG: ATP-binding protein [Parachlamydiaceae bacterium]